ncbi:HD domain-containing protein [Natroniella sulfidigena]|uniref:HD-GYP domain-containing protein n=1 Tax=Natroniella sulfidigena TaxID=723921 RepID=UPI00200B3203|nr:HD domain-containing phosphohydrolase [Natroniella sulfidigena]MCK8816785.1 HD domain-containing protein [Natroniella sulfidigena]
MIDDIKIPLFDMIMCLSETMDMISQKMVGHHEKVMYISFCIAKELNLSAKKCEEILIAAALHDVGILYLKDRTELLNFEIEEDNQHEEIGYLLVKNFKPFSEIAPLIRYHHVDWQGGLGKEVEEEAVPSESHLLHLADRIAVLIDEDKNVLNQVDRICNIIKDNSGVKFDPELVEAFLQLARKEVFWLTAVAPRTLRRFIRHNSSVQNIQLDLEGLVGLSNLFSQIIDFRSPFTASHSEGVAAVAELLAELVGMSEQECYKINVAGYLHDLGKLVVPAEILNKSARLTEQEYNIIKSHSFYTYQVLKVVDGLEEIRKWASLHHERINGEGYPFCYSGTQLPLGSKIMAVADVFTAISEDRPYRAGMGKTDAIKILEKEALSCSLDSEIISVAINNYDELSHIRKYSQLGEVRNYDRFRKELKRRI